MLGAFVLHGNNRSTLEPCLRSLRRQVDFLLTVDSGSTDGSLDIARQWADLAVTRAWRGYGSARKFALSLLRQHGADWVFFLDSDESLIETSGDVIRRVTTEAPFRQAAFRVFLHNEVVLEKASFRLSTDKRVRLFRAALEPWSERQIVHEAFPRARYPAVAIEVSHQFVTDLNARDEKQHLYALLWAIQHADSPRRVTPPRLAEMAQWLRDGLVRGAVFRGGWAAVDVVRHLSQYSMLKHHYLGLIRGGALSNLLALYQRNELETLFVVARVEIQARMQFQA